MSAAQWAKNKRLPRRYYINNGQSILLILQGDITKTKVDAIVNGLLYIQKEKECIINILFYISSCE